MSIKTKSLGLVLALALGLGGCEASDLPLAKDTTGRDPTVAEVPNPNETVRGDTDPPVVTLDIDSLHERRLTRASEIPSGSIVPATNLEGVPVTAALQAVLSGTDISLAWNAGTLQDHLVSVTNLSGPLPKVVDRICAAAKIFCSYRHGSLELSETETFIVSLPPAIRAAGSSASGGDAASNSITKAINSLLSVKKAKGEGKEGGKEKAQVDDQGGNIIYTADVRGEELVSEYLKQLRTGRPLIVLQIYLWEVTLSRENAQGINWTQLQNKPPINHTTLTSVGALTSAAGALSSPTPGSVSLGAVTTGILSVNAVASFLATKGRVQSISNPQMTFVSGSGAELKVGGTQRYISQVGTLTNASTASGNGVPNPTSSANNNTVSTDSIETGLTIKAGGSYENGVIFANLEVALKNLISLHPTDTASGTIDLPETTDEQMNTILRVRPGDNMLLAGLVTSNDNGTAQGFPLGSDSTFPLYGDESHNNREIVMIVKPSIVLFSDKSAKEADTKAQDAPSLSVPAALSASLSAPISSLPPLSLPTPTTPPAPSAPPRASVDNQLMQNAFSNALAQMAPSEKKEDAP